MKPRGFLESVGSSAKRKARKEKRKNKPKLFKKLALAGPRNAFLALVALNFTKIAEKLYASIQKNEQAVRNKWTKLGGNYDKLKGTVYKSKKVKAKIAADRAAGKTVAGFIAGEHDSDDQEYIEGIGYVGEIGVIQLAAAAALAVPIIKALSEFLGKKKDASVDVTDAGLVQTGEENDSVQGTAW